MCEVMALLGRPVPLEVRLTRHQQQFKDNGKCNACNMGNWSDGWNCLCGCQSQVMTKQRCITQSCLSAILTLIGYDIQFTSCFWMFVANLVHAL